MKIKASNFIKGILSLVFSQILIKIFGVIYSLYITNKTGFGDEGNAIYMSGYQIYALLLTASSIGVPNAISKIISEKNSIKDYINKERTFKISIFIFAVVGFVGCSLLYIFSGFVAENILQIPETKLSLMILSPAVFFVSISSVIRGYCNGEDKIFITAKSQFYEQVLKSFFTIVFVETASKLSNNNTEVMAAMANFATTLSTFCSLMYIYCKCLKNKDINFNGIRYPRERIRCVIRKVLKISIPMTTCSILTSLGKNVDSITIVRILKDIIGEESARIKYGILSSKIDILMALPLAFNTSISVALIPEISKNRAANNLKDIVKKISFSILITLFVAIPCTFGMFFYSKQIFNLLFPNASEGYRLLSLSSLGLVFSLLIQTINAILQGLGKNDVPLYSAFWGIVVKIILNIILIPIKGIYEKGAIIANIISNITSFIIVYVELIKNVEIKINICKIILKPILGSSIMIFVSLKIYNYMILQNINSNICTINSIIVAVAIYAFFIFVMKMLYKKQNSETLENTRV